MEYHKKIRKGCHGPVIIMPVMVVRWLVARPVTLEP